MDFVYNTVSHRPTGKFLRVGSKLIKGISKVQSQVLPYALEWNKANASALNQPGPLWVVIGDSMSQGIGASSYNKGWVSQLQEILNHHGANYRVINLSVSGALVEDVLNRQLPALEQLDVNPDLITVLIGSNDMLKRKTRRQLILNYLCLIEQLPVGSFLISPFGEVGIGAKINALVRSQAPTLGIKLIDNQLGSGLRSWRGKLAEDHFHPNDKGYQEMAKVFYRAMF